MAMLPKSTANTRRGTPRKNHVYSQDTVTSTGFPDRRITARTMPSRMPMIIDSTVALRVTQTPRTTWSENMCSNMNGQLNAGFVSNMFTNIAARISTAPAATQRSGKRTGTAMIGAAERPGGGSCDSGPFTDVFDAVTNQTFDRVRGGCCVALLLDIGVDLGSFERTHLDTPLLEDLFVGAVLDDGVERGGKGLGHLFVVQVGEDTVRCGVVLITDEFQLVTTFLQRIQRSGEVGQEASLTPEMMLAVASGWFWNFSMVMASSPASTHSWLRASMSSSCVVPVWTAIRMPQALSGSTSSGLPSRANHWVPEEK